MPTREEILVETVESEDSDDGAAVAAMADEPPNNLNESAFLPNMEPDHAEGRGLTGDSREFELHTFPESSESESDDDDHQSDKDVAEVVLSDPETEPSDDPVEKVRARKREKRLKDSKRKRDNYENWLKDGGASQASSKSDDSSDRKQPAKDYWSHDTAASNTTAPKQKPQYKDSSQKPSATKKAAPKPALMLKSTVETIGLEIKNNGTLVKNHISRKFKEFTKATKNQHAELLGVLKAHGENHHTLMEGIRNVKTQLDQVLAIVEKCPHKAKTVPEKPPPGPPPNQGRGSGGPENFRRRQPDPDQHQASVNRNGSIGNRNHQGNFTASPNVTVNHHIYNNPHVDISTPVVGPGYGVPPNSTGTKKRRLSAMSMALIAEKEKQAHLRRHHLELERRHALNERRPPSVVKPPPSDPYFGSNLRFD
ncbi:hypothetical protein SEMRO_572_G168750.1 [Seminavis robusta]|uniref:Uncharacterized protein n=1 Tax=Seminavis robusta TaxID=568900 RepID=A0A9N8E5J8_9STRA|nr:hypothetical protein SEMRO_572_G168750.1 [Seminavis robusta]|eukprot:Sro572_g168750.1 n/a (424) ;mRNA; f:16095-17366